MIFLLQITQKTTDYFFSVNICVICEKSSKSLTGSPIFFLCFEKILKSIKFLCVLIIGHACFLLL
jgi:hypothetical protein